jgi:hypothetical protein
MLLAPSSRISEDPGYLSMLLAPSSRISEVPGYLSMLLAPSQRIADFQTEFSTWPKPMM